MPYMIQSFRDFNTQLGTIKGKLQAQEDAAKAVEDAKKKANEEQAQTDAAYVGNANYNPMITQLALPPPGMQQQQMGFGQPQMGYGQQQQQQQGYGQQGGQFFG